MKIAYRMSPERGDTDQVFLRLAQTLAARGYRTCGLVQINTERPDDGPCDMDVQVLPDGPILRISQDLGPHSRGCRLDIGALETAVGLVQATLSTKPDCLIINKFGKQEAEGRGFRPVIADALGEGIPVLVGLNGLNKQAFLEFSDGVAEPLDLAEAAALDWLRAAMEDAVDAA